MILCLSLLVTVYCAAVNLTCPRLNFNTTITTIATRSKTPPPAAPAITGNVSDDDEATGTPGATVGPGTSDATVVPGTSAVTVGSGISDVSVVIISLAK